MGDHAEQEIDCLTGLFEGAGSPEDNLGPAPRKRKPKKDPVPLMVAVHQPTFINHLPELFEDSAPVDMVTILDANYDPPIAMTYPFTVSGSGATVYPHHGGKTPAIGHFSATTGLELNVTGRTMGKSNRRLRLASEVE